MYTPLLPACAEYIQQKQAAPPPRFYCGIHIWWFLPKYRLYISMWASLERSILFKFNSTTYYLHTSSGIKHSSHVWLSWLKCVKEEKSSVFVLEFSNHRYTRLTNLGLRFEEGKKYHFWALSLPQISYQKLIFMHRMQFSKPMLFYFTCPMPTYVVWDRNDNSEVATKWKLWAVYCILQQRKP